VEIKDSKTSSWLQLVGLQVGCWLCLPTIMVGQMLCEKYGWQGALATIAVGNAILLMIAIVYVCMIVEKRQSTLQHALETFGKRFLPLFGILLFLSLLIWFSFNVNIMSITVQKVFEKWSGTMLFSSYNFFNFILGVILSIFMLGGIKTLRVLTNISVPVLLIILLCSLFKVRPDSAIYLPVSSGLEGVSLIIGFEILYIVDLSMFFQSKESHRDGIIAMACLYGVCIPIVEAFGVYLFYATGGITIIDFVMLDSDISSYVVTAIFLIFSGWAISNINLYSASINSAFLLPRWSFKQRTLLLGAVGSILACFDPMEYFDFLLKFSGIALGAMGAVILSGFLLGVNKESLRPFLAWLAGLVVGFVTLAEFFTITQVPALDAFITAYTVSMLLTKREIYDPIALRAREAGLVRL
jgi:purine-cytosine permease-like protein